MRILILTSLILTAACSNANFAGEQSLKKPAATPAPTAQPSPQSQPQQPGVQEPNFTPTQPLSPAPSTPSGPSFWDQTKQWWNGLDFNNGIEFGSWTQSFHIGNGEFSGSSECAARLRFNTLDGTVFRFSFQVVEPNSTVNIQIDSICGIDKTYNYVSMYRADGPEFYSGLSELTQHHSSLSPSQSEHNFNQMVLQPGWYEIRVYSPEYTMSNGEKDHDDFKVGKVKIKSDKQINKGQVLADN